MILSLFKGKTWAIAVVIALMFGSAVSAESYELRPDNAFLLNGEMVKFHYALDPGQEIHDTLTVNRKITSKDQDQVEITYFAVDANMTANGFVGMKGENEPQQLLGSWIEFSEKTDEITDQSSVDFILKIPENATPGQYLGGLVVTSNNELQGFKSIPKLNGVISKIKHRYATTILVDVAGEITPKFEVKNFDYSINHGVLNLNFDFFNIGNTVYELGGDFLLDGLVKNERLKIPFRRVIQGENVRISVNFEDMYKFIGTFDINLNLNANVVLLDRAKFDQFSDQKSLHYFPIYALVILGLIFLAIYGIIHRLLKGGISLKNTENLNAYNNNKKQVKKSEKSDIN